MVCAGFVLVRLFTLRRSFSPHTTEVMDFGMFAQHLREGVLAPPWAYMPLVREGGCLLFGAFCAPIFSLLGPSLFALRTANVLWHALVLAVFGALAWRVGRHWGVLVMGGLWTLAPPALVELQQFGWANHLETTLLGGLAVLSFARSMGSRSRSGAVAWAFGAGLFAGVAPFFTYVGLSMLAAMILSVALCRMWRIGWWPVVALVLGIGVGLVPLLEARLDWFASTGPWNPASDGSPSYLLAGAQAPVAGQDGLLLRGVKLVGVRLPLFFSSKLGGVLLFAVGLAYASSLATLAVLGALRIPCADRPRLLRSYRAVLTACATTVVVHLLACSLSGYDTAVLADRYLAPLVPFAMLLACAGVPAWRGRRASSVRWRLPVVLAACAIPLLVGTWTLVELACHSPVAYRERNFKGYYYLPSMTEALSTRTFAELVALSEARPGDRFELLRLAGEEVGVSAVERRRGSGELWPTAAEATIAEFRPAAQPWLWEGVGLVVVPAEPVAARADHPPPVQLNNRSGLAALTAVPRGAYGIGASTSDRTREILDEIAHDGQPGVRSRQAAVCAGAAGTWTRQRYVLLLSGPSDHSWVHGCDEAWLAVGVGMQLARESLPDASWPDGEPLLTWWIRSGWKEQTQEAFLCGYEAEMEMLAWLESESRQHSEATDPLERCLGAETVPF